MQYLRLHFIGLLFLVPAAAAGGCSNARSSQDAAAPARDRPSAAVQGLGGTAWQLVSFGDAVEDAPRAATGAPAITVLFEKKTATSRSEEGRLSGSAGCNRYFGRYRARKGRLLLSQVGATRKACRPSVMEQERVYLAALEAVEGWERTGGRFDLLDETGQPLLRFEAKEELKEHSPGSGEAMAPQRTGETDVYACTDPAGGGGADFSFTTRTGPGELAVWLPARFATGADTTDAGQRYLVLGQVRSADGAKYEGDGVMVWNKGDEALLVVEGERYPGCTLQPDASPWAEARRRGVDFRAVGQEPGWHLEIREGERIRFTYAYGQKKAVTPAPSPRTDVEAGRTVYHAQTEAHDLTVSIEDESCTDAMSGRRFEKTVHVQLDGTTYRGCGRSLD